MFLEAKVVIVVYKAELVISLISHHLSSTVSVFFFDARLHECSALLDVVGRRDSWAFGLSAPITYLDPWHVGTRVQTDIVNLLL